MKTYKVTIKYPIFEATISAKNKKEAEDIALFDYDNADEEYKEPQVIVKEIKK